MFIERKFFISHFFLLLHRRHSPLCKDLPKKFFLSECYNVNSVTHSFNNYWSDLDHKAVKKSRSTMDKYKINFSLIPQFSWFNLILSCRIAFVSFYLPKFFFFQSSIQYHFFNALLLTFHLDIFSFFNTIVMTTVWHVAWLITTIIYCGWLAGCSRNSSKKNWLNESADRKSISK